MTRAEYLLAAAVLRILGALFGLFPIRRRRVVLATARTSRLEGNLRSVYDAMRARFPRKEYVLLLEPYGYDRRRKLSYLGRLIRGMYHLRRASLVVVDNAYLPIHVAPHRTETTVVQVWHAAGALKRFGRDVHLDEPERSFLHRYYDYVVVSSEAGRDAYASALATPRERVLPLGSPRAGTFFRADALATARARTLEALPELRDRTVVLYAPTFRGRGAHKRAPGALDAPRLRAALPERYALVTKWHPNLAGPPRGVRGFDVVADHGYDINELFTVTDVLVTDYSSCIFDFALLRRPIVLLVGDLEEYERDPGLYLDYRTEMIGTQVADTDGVTRAILEGRFDLAPYDAFIERHLGPDPGGASDRFVDRFLGPQRP